MNRSAARPHAFALGLLLVCGCGGGEDDRPKLGTVTGTVLMDNKPLPRAQVVFAPEGGRSSTGVTDDKGDYSLTYLYRVPGATIGTHKVLITTWYEDDASPEAQKAKEKIPARYNKKTTLTADVKTGANRYDFDLQSK